MSSHSYPIERNNASIFEIHPDIIRTHILTRRDGPTLVSAGSASSELSNFCKDEELWTNICNSMWPSTTDDRLVDIINKFPAGYRSFFGDSFSTPEYSRSNHKSRLVKQETNDHHSLLPSQLISAVDIHYNNLVFSKVERKETWSDWFLSSPFWVDLLDPKQPISTSEKLLKGNNDLFRSQIDQNLTLSWILVDPVSRQAANLSSLTPVSVERNWLNDDVLAHYVTFIRDKSSLDFVQCSMVVVCGREEEELQVKEVSLLVKDMDGKSLSGKESLVILQEAIEGGRMKKGKREEEKERYEEFMEKGRERRERKQRRERRMDMMCILTGITIFSAFSGFIWLLSY